MLPDVKDEMYASGMVLHTGVASFLPTGELGTGDPRQNTTPCLPL